MTLFNRNAALNEAARTWTGGYRAYDLVKEVAIAIVGVAAVAVVLTILLSSPDERATTVQSWSRAMPVNFLETELAQLDGTSGTAEYGPPYNHNADGQHIGPIYLQKWLGVSHPIDTARDYVIKPLRSIPNSPALTVALAQYVAAGAATRAAWTGAYKRALEKAAATGPAVRVPAGAYGPVGPMMSSALALAQSGGLDGALLASRQFYNTDYTKPLLLLSDGGELERRAEGQHLLGGQWGMMNETGSYPGQVWLWLYTLWYQIEPFEKSENADALVMLVMLVLSLGLILIPFIPGVRAIPRLIPIYRLIWRRHYREQRAGGIA